MTGSVVASRARTRSIAAPPERWQPRCSACCTGASRERLVRQPAFHGLVVLALRLDPGAGRAVAEMLALPERGAGLEVVHQELRRRDGGAAMRGGGGDEDYPPARDDPPEAVD